MTILRDHDFQKELEELHAMWERGQHDDVVNEIACAPNLAWALALASALGIWLEIDARTGILKGENADFFTNALGAFDDD